MARGLQATTTSKDSRRQHRKLAQQQAKRAERRRRLLLLAGLAAMVVAGAVFLVSRLNDSPDSGVPDINWASVPQDGSTLGDPNAPVTIVEYADYQCPACGYFAREILPRIVQDYVNSGKVRIEFRVRPFLSPLPLTDPGNESVQAAEAAMCAGDQGHYWEYNHALFTHQNGENAGAFSQDNLTTLADDLGMNTTAFTACLDTGTHQQAVIDSKTASDSAGITQTPTLIINGQQVFLTTSGYPPLKQQIETALTAAGES